MLFSDNAASFTAVKELTVRHAALSAERDRLQERLSTTGRAAQVCRAPMHANPLCAECYCDITAGVSAQESSSRGRSILLAGGM